MAMARFFEEEAKDAIVGKRILELASGTGILGLHLGLMGAEHVVMTDKASMKQLLERNIAENEALFSSTEKRARMQAASLVSARLHVHVHICRCRSLCRAPCLSLSLSRLRLR